MTVKPKVKKLTVLQRLEADLNAKDEELAGLYTRLALMTAHADKLEAAMPSEEERERWKWGTHVVSEKETLPVPRLEIRWERYDGGRYEWVAKYNFIHQHLLGHFVIVPMGFTKCGMGSERSPLEADGKVYVPWRDGCHIRHDMASLKLPGFAVYGEHVMQLEAVE